MNLTRFESLIGEDKLNKIKNLNVLVLGLGGVGGYVVESLTRCGIGKITLVDGDTIKPSNINRQIIVTKRNINHYKTKEWKKRIKLINKDAIVNLVNLKITESNIELLFSDKYDYVIDACDTTVVKVKLAEECYKRNIKLISCMGTANKLDATKLKITTLDKTDYDPLAKKIRGLIKNKDIMRSVAVVSSIEKAINVGVLGSTAYVPGVAGLLITNYLVNDVLGNK